MTMTTSISTLALPAALAVLTVLPATAHHSTAAFDTSRVVKIEGTITLFRWINPHASIKIDGVSDGDDPDGVWTVEMTAPNVLINQGWTRTALKVGDEVTMFVNPLRNAVTLNDGSTGSLYVGAILADGSQLGQLADGAQTRGVKGDQQRRYLFAEAGAEMPYRLYVPQSYDPAKSTPLVVALHGYGGNQDYFFTALEELPELLEQHGFIFAAPMGYSTSGWYGAPLDIPGNRPRSSGQPPPPVTQSPEEMKRERQLSETDVMNVLALVTQEYNIDPDRTFLMGHSMGGMGTYVLGQKYAEKWAAIAVMSGTLADAKYDLERLRKVAVMLSAGEQEAPVVEAAKAQIEALRALGIETGLFVAPGASHGSMIAPTIPKALEFFSDKTRNH
jgi:poly(3-hydroxybutyrate) depolymerase